MNLTRHGKIAQLPLHIREQLNERLSNGETGQQLVDWLNSLPQTQKVLADHFEGHAIREQNLSDWRSGGYREWLLRQEVMQQAIDVSTDAGKLKLGLAPALADDLAMVLAARYAAWLNKWNGETGEDFEKELRMLRALCQDITLIQRTKLQIAHLKS